jgi:methylenetetrahydrofolate dehydrogenase (NADP+)/methenyltetrahydrofolate cyclohydrolase
VPAQISQQVVIDTIDAAKDVDGLNPANAGRLVSGLDALTPCTPLGSVILAKETLGDLTGKHAVVIGRSNLVGKPVAQLLLRENCTVTTAHSRTGDLPAMCRQADILVAAVGIPEMVKGDWVKPGACVIDVGINRIDAPEKGEGTTRLVGDVAYAEAAEIAAHITPVPGGVGPMTIACLLRNTLTAFCRQNGFEEIEV